MFLYLHAMYYVYRPYLGTGSCALHSGVEGSSAHALVGSPVHIPVLEVIGTHTRFWECLDVFNDTWGLGMRLKGGKQMNLPPQKTARLLSGYQFKKDRHEQPFSACHRWQVFSNPKDLRHLAPESSWFLGVCIQTSMDGT